MPLFRPWQNALCYRGDVRGGRAMTLAGLFIGEDRKLRFFWRAILFIVLGIALQPALHPLYNWIVARYERRSIGSYGMPIAEALSANTFEGFAIGIVFAGAVAIGMLALGGMQVHGLALTGQASCRE